jgi:tetratricopeptide (TPR) repeat protein
VLKPYVASFLNKAGFERLGARDYAAAVRLLKRGQRVDPNNINTVALLSDAFRSGGNFRDAAATYERWSSLEPNYSPALNGLGYCYTRLGEYGRAEEAYRRALAINPLNFAALNNLANLFLLKREYTRALPLFEQGAARNDRISRENRPNFAEALFQLGRYEDALAIYQQLYDESPGDWRLAQRLAECYQRLGKTKEAESLITRLRILNATRD